MIILAGLIQFTGCHTTHVLTGVFQASRMGDGRLHCL
jgi:hypothetical protein